MIILIYCISEDIQHYMVLFAMAGGRSLKKVHQSNLFRLLLPSSSTVFNNLPSPPPLCSPWLSLPLRLINALGP